MEPVNRSYRKFRERQSRGNKTRTLNFRSRSDSARVTATATPAPKPAKRAVLASSTSRSRSPVKSPPRKRKQTSTERKLGMFRDEESATVSSTAATDSQEDESDLESVASEFGAGEEMDPLGYKFIRNDVWSKLIKGLKCPLCAKECLEVKSKSDRGFACKIQVVCQECEQIVTASYTSPKFDYEKGSPYEINKKLSQAFLANGAGHSGMEKMSIQVNMKCMSRKTYTKFVKLISSQSSEFIGEVLALSRKIVRAAYQDEPCECCELGDDDPVEIFVSFDGSWHKRGRTSAYGIGLVIDVLTGIVVDFHVVCKECSVCNRQESALSAEAFQEWLKGHQDSGACDKNYSGSSQSMETAIAEVLWSRSEQFGFQYTKMLSDGDAKSFAHISSLGLYDGKEIFKEECLNHVGKRLGEGLKNVVKTCKAQKITLGGQAKGSLTEGNIKTLQSYYQNAIKKNAPSTQQMKMAVMATPYHACSSDAKPMHQFCPGGGNSWGKYNKEIAKGKKPPKHEDFRTTVSLRPQILEYILPVYKRLSDDALLARCANVGTQNNNESIHSAIWANCPKTKSTDRRKVEIAVASAVSEFNMGCEATLRLRAKVAGETVGNDSIQLSKRRDTERTRKSIAKSSAPARQVRKNCKIKKHVAEMKNLRQEGKTYHAGGFE